MILVIVLSSEDVDLNMHCMFMLLPMSHTDILFDPRNPNRNKLSPMEAFDNRMVPPNTY